MKKCILTALIFCFPLLAGSQTFTEIFDYGWGQGLKDSKPFFIDIDQDNLLDLIIGEYDGTLNHYEQSSVNSSQFTLISQSFNDIRVGIFAAPVFTDLDSDGLLDLIIGEQDGNLNHYEQTSVGSYEFVLITEFFNNIDIQDKSVPAFLDLDHDGFLDLIISSQNGTIFHYKQSSDPQVFTLVSANFSGINAGFFGTICFADFDHDGLYDMLTGRNPGYLDHYEQDSLNALTFSLAEHPFSNIDVGGNSAPRFTDFDHDGILDLIVGEMKGNLYHYKQQQVNSTTFSLLSENFLNVFNIGYDSAPCFTDLNNDGYWDMIVGDYDGTLWYFEQNDMDSESFDFVTESFNDIEVGKSATPCITNLDNDGLFDLIVGNDDGYLYYYEQTFSGSDEFTLVTDRFSNIDVGDNAAPCFADLDNDGLLDLIIGEYDGTLEHWEQNGTGSTSFHQVSASFNDIYVGQYYSVPFIADLDSDGLLDLIIGHAGSTILHYEQESIGSYNFALVTDNFINVERGRELKPAFVDVNNDGDLDLFIGESCGGLYFFRQEGGSFVPQNSLSKNFTWQLYQNYPNPFNPVTELIYDMTTTAQVSITVYDILGRTVKVLYNNLQQAGSHSVQWDATDEQGRSVASGIYLCRMQANDFNKTVKLMLVR